MKIVIWSFLMILCPLVLPAQDFSLFDSALAQVNMTTEDVRFDLDEMATWGQDHWQLDYFSMFHKNPFKLPKYGELIKESFINNFNVTRMVRSAGRKADLVIFRGLMTDPLVDYTGENDTLPHISITSSKNILNGEDFRPLRNRIDMLYRIADDGEFFFKKTLKDFDDDGNRNKLLEFFLRDNTKHNDFVEELAENFDFNRFMAGAQDLAEAARRIADSLEYFAFPDKIKEIQTRKGLVVVGTPGPDEYNYLVPPLLILDGGGDDVYKLKGYPEEYPLSIIIDVAGNDQYLSEDTTKPGIGGAVLGMSIVIDKAGNDIYQGANVCQGAGIFGVGVLMDYSGDDVYSSRSYSQGSGVFGFGILADSAGNDTFNCLANSQGYGYTKGCGMLVNYEGDDNYIAEDIPPDNSTDPTDSHNASMSQGVGFGKRADFIDGHSWAGGVGILCDLKGNDSYSAGLFGQGCGYWFGLGMLLDGAGDDSYTGGWYTQGTAAHFAVGYLDDFGGDDSYSTSVSMALGAGHDFSIGYLNERGGDDIYRAPDLSLGGSNTNGIGIFFDHNGSDRYLTNGGITLGKAVALERGPKKYLCVFGIFVDGGGEDEYREAYAGNGMKWISPKSSENISEKFEIGVGIDK